MALIGAVHLVDSAAQLINAIRATRAIAVVAELFDVDGNATTPALEYITVHFPMIAIVLYVVPTPPALHELVHAGHRLATRAVIVRGADDVLATVRTAIEQAGAVTPIQAILGATAHLIPRALRPLVEYCAQSAHHPISTASAIAAGGLPRRTLYKRLRDADLPPLERLIQWHRALHAAWYLADSAHTIKGAASALGYPSTAALRKALRSCAGCSPTELRRRGGFGYLLARHVTALHGRRRSDLAPGAQAASSASRSLG